jgi:TonB family protein
MPFFQTILAACALCMPSDTPPHLLPFPEDVLKEQSVFTPYHKKPELLNRAEVKKAFVQAYAAHLRERGLEATVQVWIQLDVDGRTMNVSVAERSKYPELNEAALKVARVMRFSPALKDGRGVATTVQVPFVFTRSAYERNKE